MPDFRRSLAGFVAALALVSACGGGTENTGAAGSSAGGPGGGAAGSSGGGSAGAVGQAGVGGSGPAGSGPAGASGATGVAGSGGAGPAGAGGAGPAGAGGGVAGTGGGAAGRGGAGGSGPAGAGGRGGAAGGAGGTGGSATGCPGAAVFCDDFEAGTVGQPPNATRWMLSRVGGNGPIQIDNAQFHGGSKSLLVNGTNQFHTMAMVTGAPVFPLPAGVLYGRAWLRLSASAGQSHVTWIEAGSVMNDQMETRIGSNLGVMDINRWPGDTEQRAPGNTLQAGMWYCIEFMFDSAADVARVWLGGNELTDLHVTNWVAPNPQNGNNTTPIPNWAPDYQAVRFGWELNGSSIWFDDVALGYSRINCQ